MPHGFCKNHSMSYLTKLIATIQHQKGIHRKVAGLFLLMQKAFNSVWHKGMIYRLLEIGVKGKLLELLKCFLYDRRVSIEVNNHTSLSRKCWTTTGKCAVATALYYIQQDHAETFTWAALAVYECL